VGFAEKVQLLGDARALLNPIQWDEPFGMVMVEALACGTPVIACRRGAAPEIVEDGVTGFLCERPRELPARIGDVSELDRSTCRSAVRRSFSTARMVAEHIQLYEQVADGPALALGLRSAV
jgi:glycosyltransferase involved in cell wall biosynthesis